MPRLLTTCSSRVRWNSACTSRTAGILLALGLCASGLGACSPGAETTGTSHVALPKGAGVGAPATIERVVDGDTVDLLVDGRGSEPERARLLGIDTPETVKPDSPVECFGPEASAATKHLLPPGTKVLIQLDAEARDRYGRLLVYVWRASDKAFINRDLLAEGFAKVLSIAPNTAHAPELAAAAGAARTAGLGVWGKCR